jgi:hypothetical protein
MSSIAASSFGSRLPSRSRGTWFSPGPIVVKTILRLVPLHGSTGDHP